MGSPTLTVSVLLVLWLIVIVPMIFRRKDERAQERSVQRFGRAMRSLTRRSALPRRPAARSREPPIPRTRPTSGRARAPTTTRCS